MRPFPKDAGGRWAPVLVFSAIFACSAAASEAKTAAGLATEAPAQGVPKVPLVSDIDSLDRVELRREIGRAEGRLSDLRKEHAAAMRGLAAEAERIPDRTSDPNDGQTGNQDGNQADGQGGEQPEPERSPADRRADVADRRRRATAQFERGMAAARHRLEQLLDRQALIDPAALDQTRLRPTPARPPATAEADAR